MAWLTNWNYRKKITVTNSSGGTLTNVDVLITIDTATPINSGNMQSLGQDIVICSEDTNTKYNYWVESCFNTTTTDVWFRVASLPNGNSIFYIYYGNSSASSPTEAQTYTGPAIFMYSGSVPSGPTNHALMNGK